MSYIVNLPWNERASAHCWRQARFLRPPPAAALTRAPRCGLRGGGGGEAEPVHGGRPS